MRRDASEFFALCIVVLVAVFVFAYVEPHAIERDSEDMERAS